MKIVRIIARLNVGGPAQHTVWLTAGMNSHGLNSVLVSGEVPAGEEDMTYFAEAQGVKPFYIPEMSRELSARDIKVVWRILHLLIREQPDVVHTHTAKAGAVGRTAALLYRIVRKLSGGRPVAVFHTFHGHVFHGYYGRLRSRMFLAIERLLARTATTRVIVLSEQQRAEICDRYDVAPINKVEVIPLGLDLDRFGAWRDIRRPAREHLGLRSEETAIAIIGRLTEVKNHELFLAAIAELKRRQELGSLSRFRTFIVGDGHLRQQLTATAARLGLTSVVTFLGARSDVERLYPAMDIVALSSRNEGTPLTLIEAMACGRPFVSTNVGGVVDLAGPAAHGLAHDEGMSVQVRGILVHRHEEGAFADGLQYLLDHPDVRARLGADGMDYVRSRHSLDRLISDTSRLYRRALDVG